MYSYYINIYVKYNGHDKWVDGCKADFLDGIILKEILKSCRLYFVL